MSHDLLASISSASIANILTDQSTLFTSETINNLSIYASREGKTSWPFADGVIVIEEEATVKYKMAVEFKRVNEGIHGILTALGQSQAYLKKGYNGTIIIIPEVYNTHEAPGEYLKSVLDLVGEDLPIMIFTYKINGENDLEVNCIRNIDLSTTAIDSDDTTNQTNTISTQWAHLREGSTEPDTFYRYLQMAKRIDLTELNEPTIEFPIELLNALPNDVDPLKYLSNAPGDTYHDFVWRHFWFTYIINERTLPLFTLEGDLYKVCDASSSLLKNDGLPKYFLVGKSNSPKNKIIGKLNAGTINEEQAWVEYAQKIKDRAHSFREDIDSSLYHIGMIDEDGKPTSIGYKFVDACERNRNDSINGTPLAIFETAIIQHGELGAFIHYISLASQKIFKDTPLKYSVIEGNEFKSFNSNNYLKEVEEILANDIKVIRKVSLRGGVGRKPFQAELAVLGFLGFFKKGRNRFKPVVGLDIDWEKVYTALNREI
ncbi:hypothetical protein JTI58_04010 [Lysinibacillus fusiformis]|uniref:BfuAI n=1 Tax=Lysinibacillus fusiformis TaxID=28031 RepID=E5LGB1_9BACI|nr:hypothetical protein [Lysinibacillus fusiformis]ADQ20499.1 BfuAI [Lysinibacillus fusiformis]QSB10848.1 hypothetical protein JTI58_04010 [Lysinibacillus fusiformis]